MKFISARLRAAGLKVYAPKWSFGLNYITYLGYAINQDGITPYPKKVQGIMYLLWSTTTTKSLAIVGMVQKYSNIWSRRYHISSPLEESSAAPKGGKMFCNYSLDNSFKELRQIFSADSLLNYPDWVITFTVHTYSYDKQLGDFISHNNKPIVFFPRRLIKLQRNYTTT